MTQVKLRFSGGKGMTEAAWKYLLWRGQHDLWKTREKRQAAAKKNITLPKLKWMERSAEPDAN